MERLCATIETSEAMLGNIGVPEEEDKKKDHEKICFDF